MTPTEIRIALLMRRLTMAEIARSLGVSQPAVQRVIYRDSVSERIMAAVADNIGIPKDRVFPEHQFDNQP